VQNIDIVVNGEVHVSTCLLELTSRVVDNFLPSIKYYRVET